MSPPLALWEKEAQVVELEKGELGLGFSILDYQVRNCKIEQTGTGRTLKISSNRGEQCEKRKLQYSVS